MIRHELKVRFKTKLERLKSKISPTKSHTIEGADTKELEICKNEICKHTRGLHCAETCTNFDAVAGYCTCTEFK